MEIVIDIDKGLYERIKYLEPHKNDMLDTLMRAVQKGTPLPKGHKRLIEDNFEVGPVFDKEGYMIGYKYVIQEDLNNALTIIEADDAEEKNCETCQFDGMCSPNVRLIVKHNGCPKWTPKKTATKEGE